MTDEAGTCSECGGPTEVERPNDDGLTVSVCRNEDCVLNPGVSVGERASRMTDSALDHALSTAESALGSSRHLEGIVPVDGGKPSDAVEALESVAKALRTEKRRRENEDLGGY